MTELVLDAESVIEENCGSLEFDQEEYVAPTGVPPKYSLEARVGVIDGRLEGVDKQLDSIEAMLIKLTPTPPTHFKLWVDEVKQWLLANWKAALPVLAICLTVTGWFVTAQYKAHVDSENSAFEGRIDNRMNLALNKPSGVEERLRTIEADAKVIKATLEDFRPLLQELLRRDLDAANKMPVSILSKQLPTLATTLAAAKSQGVNLQPEQANDLSKKLSLVSRASPGYYNAAASLLSFRSSSFTNVPPELVARITPTGKSTGKCLDYPLETYKNPNPLPPSAGPAVETFIFRDCTLDLDDPDVFKNSAAISLVSPQYRRPKKDYSIILLKVRIVYRGGPLIPFTQLAMYGCTFDFRLSSPAPEQGQRLVQALLAPDFTEGSVHVSLHS